MVKETYCGDCGKSRDGNGWLDCKCKNPSKILEFDEEMINCGYCGDLVPVRETEFFKCCNLNLCDSDDPLRDCLDRHSRKCWYGGEDCRDV